MEFAAQISLAGKSQGMGVEKSTSPGAAIFNGNLYVFYTGDGANGVWYTSSSDGQDWTPNVLPVAGATCKVRESTSPGAVAFNGSLYVFYAEGVQDQSVSFSSTPDGKNWFAPVVLGPQISNMGMYEGSSPSAAVLDGTLYLFYSGIGNDGLYFVTSPNGSSWSPVVKLASLAPNINVYEGTSPSAVVFQNTLYVFYTGSGDNGIWYTTTTDGQSWTQIVQMTQSGMEGEIRTSPNAFVANGTLYVAYTGTAGDQNQAVCYSTLGANGWTAVQSMRDNIDNGVQGVYGGTSPCGIGFSSAPFVFWNGSGNDGIYYSSGRD